MLLMLAAADRGYGDRDRHPPCPGHRLLHRLVFTAQEQLARRLRGGRCSPCGFARPSTGRAGREGVRGRTRGAWAEEAHDAVGQFFSILPVRVKIDSSQHLVEWLTALQWKVTEIGSHEYLAGNAAHLLAAGPASAFGYAPTKEE
jgi:hypothetical protein